MTNTLATVGFIMLRHVNNELSNKYWTECYKSIRKYYPHHDIVIIDDNSDCKYVKNMENIELYKTKIIDSEYPGRGELLPYYYYSKEKFFDIAVILHDSTIIQQHINFYVEKYKILWEFDHYWDNPDEETRIIKEAFNCPDLINFYSDKSLWKGCFEGMTVITHDFLILVNAKYDMSKLLNFITNKSQRSCFERIIACLLQKHYKIEPMFCNIHQYCPWGITYYDKEKFSYLPILKIWTGR